MRTFFVITKCGDGFMILKPLKCFETNMWKADHIHQQCNLVSHRINLTTNKWISLIHVASTYGRKRKLLGDKRVQPLPHRLGLLICRQESDSIRGASEVQLSLDSLYVRVSCSHLVTVVCSTCSVEDCAGPELLTPPYLNPFYGPSSH